MRKFTAKCEQYSPLYAPQADDFALGLGVLVVVDVEGDLLHEAFGLNAEAAPEGGAGPLQVVRVPHVAGEVRGLSVRLLANRACVHFT